MNKLIRVAVPFVLLLVSLADCSLFDQKTEIGTVEPADIELTITQPSTKIPTTAIATNTATSTPTHTETITPSKTSTFTPAPSATSTRSSTPTQIIVTPDINTPLTTKTLVQYVGDRQFSGVFDNVKIKFWISSDGEELTNLTFIFLKAFMCNEGKYLLFEGVDYLSTGVDITISVSKGVFYKENNFMDFGGIIIDNEAEGEIYLAVNGLLPSHVIRGKVCTFGPVKWTAKAR